jgi:hypothetical protein
MHASSLSSHQHHPITSAYTNNSCIQFNLSNTQMRQWPANAFDHELKPQWRSSLPHQSLNHSTKFRSHLSLGQHRGLEHTSGSVTCQERPRT